MRRVKPKKTIKPPGRPVTTDIAGSVEERRVGIDGRVKRSPDLLLLAQMKADYEAGSTIKGALGMSAKYNRDPQTIREIAKREGWVRNPAKPPVVTTIAVPETVELDLTEQVLLSDIGTMDMILEGYAAQLVVWRDLCEKVKRGEFIEQEVYDPKTQQIYVKKVPVEVNPFLFGHKDMKDWVASIINAQKQRKALVEQLPMAKGVSDIEGQISEMAKLIQQGGIAPFQRSELPDVCYSEKKPLQEKDRVSEGGVIDPEKDIEDELKKDGIFII